jgi:predicted dehydrogenase
LAAVDAGKHVYLAKPVAVDAPGCLTVGEAGRRAESKKQVFLVDFQTRANEHFRKAVGLVHQEAIGKLANRTVARSVRSTLTAILGREAAYRCA